jgi:hypothetical protein
MPVYFGVFKGKFSFISLITLQGQKISHSDSVAVGSWKPSSAINIRLSDFKIE